MMGNAHIMSFYLQFFFLVACHLVLTERAVYRSFLSCILFLGCFQMFICCLVTYCFTYHIYSFFFFSLKKNGGLSRCYCPAAG